VLFIYPGHGINARGNFDPGATRFAFILGTNKLIEGD
jgi:hypothetical protein